MSDINPFSQPPLVEWENCVTHFELHEASCVLKDIEQKLPWWKAFEKYKLRLSVGVVESIIQWIHDGKPSVRRTQ
jgi:hypothetical protein